MLSHQPLYFGRDRTNRYDDPNQHYGVLYLGADLATALMESVFHKHKWTTSKRRPITLTEIESRLVRVVGVLDNLQLANLDDDGITPLGTGMFVQTGANCPAQCERKNSST